MEKIELSSLQKRVLTSLIMIPMVVGALYLGHPFVDVLIFLVGALLSWEWATMIPNKKTCVYGICYTFLIGCSLIIFNRTILFSILALTMLFIYFKAKDEPHKKLLILGAPYISIGVGSLYWIYYLFGAFGGLPGEKTGFVMTFWFIVMVWSVDIGGYVVGSTVKGPKLAPKISPNKTWSGLVGGVILAVAVNFIYMIITKHVYSLTMPISEQLKFAQFAALIAIIAQIGDLCESAIKRHLKIKDSSNLIPGHGGIFDRIDGLIFAAPFVYCLFSFLSF